MDSLALTSGTLPYPVTFLISDLITEIWGRDKAYKMLRLSFIACLIAFIVQYLFFESARLSGILILASLIAFGFGQAVDIALFEWIKKKTRGRYLWIRNQTSTAVSQIVDTMIINSILLFWGLELTFQEAYPVMVGNLVYKFFFALVTVPLLYLGVSWLRVAQQKIQPTSIVRSL